MRMPVEWPLRIGCGFVNLYAGFYLVTDPTRYHRFVPGWLTWVCNSLASVDVYLRIQGIGELMIALTLFAWFAPRWAVRAASLTLAFEMTLILFFIGIDGVTFRNVGLLGAAVSLVLATYSEQPERSVERSYAALQREA